MVWQGFLFRERLVPMIGLRRDRNRTMASESVPNPLTQLPDLAPPLNSFRGPWVSAAGNTTTKGFVFKATKWLHLHYNQADSFTPAVAAVNILGESLPYPTGTPHGLRHNAAQVSRKSFSGRSRGRSLDLARRGRRDF